MAIRTKRPDGVRPVRDRPYRREAELAGFQGTGEVRVAISIH